MSNGTEFKKEEIIFMQFVIGLSQSGMMQLGKIMNPMTQKIEKDLHAAQATIDMLCMLREKTKGNLSKSEEDILTNSISSLQMNYVDEADKKEEEPEEKPEEEKEKVEEAKEEKKEEEKPEAEEQKPENEEQKSEEEK